MEMEIRMRHKRSKKILKEADRTAIRKSSNRFKENHVIQCKSMGMIQLVVNDHAVATIDTETKISIGKLMWKHYPVVNPSDKVRIEIHNCTSTTIFSLENDEKVWLKSIKQEGLF